MTHFLKNGNSYSLANEETLEVYKKLPVGNYIIKLDKNDNFYLEMIDSFSLSGKLYGDIEKNANRMINTFLDRENSTGVLLLGEKGSGKTLLSKLLSLECAKKEIPTILINMPYVGEEFNQFIQDINQPCVILFDEFEKVYDSKAQESILTLLDGVYPSKKMFILTCNDSHRLGKYLNNRPGRIYYRIDFSGLEENFIREYTIDNIKNKDNIEQVCKITSILSSFNFDMLKSLIEEMNRYDESAQESIKMLNIKPENNEDSYYEVSYCAKNSNSFDRIETWHGNPLNKEKMHFYVPYTDIDGNEDEICIYFSVNDLEKYDQSSKSYIFKNSDDHKVCLTKVSNARMFNPMSF